MQRFSSCCISSNARISILPRQRLAANFPVTDSPEKTYAAALFHTGWFIESIFTQTLIVHIIRTNRIPFVQSKPSAGLLLSTLGILAVGAYLPYSPLATYLGLVPLPLVYWAWIAGFMACYAVLTNTVKQWFNRRFGV